MTAAAHSWGVSQQSRDDQIASVVRRLSGMTGLPADAVEPHVRQAFAQWDGATVRDFVPIFVERSLRNQLVGAHQT